MRTGFWLTSPECRYKYYKTGGESSYKIDTGPYRESGIRDDANDLNYYIDQWYHHIYPPGGINFNGNWSEHEGHYGQIYTTHRDYFYSSGSNWSMVTSTPAGFVVSIPPNSQKYCGYIPGLWDADFTDILQGDNPDKIVGYELFGDFGFRRFLDQNQCFRSDYGMSEEWYQWWDDSSETGRAAYQAFVLGGGANYTTASQVSVTYTVSSRKTTTAPSGNFRVYTAGLTDFPLATAYPNPDSGGITWRRVPSETFVGNVVHTVVPPTEDFAPDEVVTSLVPPKTVLFFTGSYEAFPPTTASGPPSWSVAGNIYFKELEFTVYSPWTWRYLMAGEEAAEVWQPISNLRGSLDTTQTYFD